MEEKRGLTKKDFKHPAYYYSYKAILDFYFVLGIFLISGIIWFYIFYEGVDIFVEAMFPVQAEEFREETPNLETDQPTQVLDEQESNTAIGNIANQIGNEVETPTSENTTERATAQRQAEANEAAQSQNNSGGNNSENTNFRKQKADYSFWISIPKIGVDNNIYFDSNVESGLSKGIWSPDISGTPTSNTPVILASHRYGLSHWGDERTRAWFFYLDKMQNGDTFTLKWQDKNYTYVVTSVTQGKSLEKSDFDLLLYTCQDINGESTIFLTADRI